MSAHHLSTCLWPLVFLRGEIQVKLYKLSVISMYSTMTVVPRLLHLPVFTGGFFTPSVIGSPISDIILCQYEHSIF